MRVTYLLKDPSVVDTKSKTYHTYFPVVDREYLCRSMMDGVQGGLHVRIVGSELLIVLSDEEERSDCFVGESVQHMEKHLKHILPKKRLFAITLKMANIYLEEHTPSDNSFLADLCRVVVECANGNRIRKFRLLLDNNEGINDSPTTNFITERIGPLLPTSITTLELDGVHNNEDTDVGNVPMMNVNHFVNLLPGVEQLSIGILRINIPHLCTLLERHCVHLRKLDIHNLLSENPDARDVERDSDRDCLARTLHSMKKKECKTLVVVFHLDPSEDIQLELAPHHEIATVVPATDWIVHSRLEN